MGLETESLDPTLPPEGSHTLVSWSQDRYTSPSFLSSSHSVIDPFQTLRVPLNESTHYLGLPLLCPYTETHWWRR